MSQEEMNQEKKDYQSTYTYDRSRYDYDPQDRRPKPTNGLAVAALIVGILSILTCCCGVGGVIFGCAGIFLAVLSKEGGPMEGNALAGLILSVIGVILGFIILIGAIFFIRNADQDFDIHLYDYAEELPWDSTDELPYEEDSPRFYDGYTLDELFSNDGVRSM